MDRLLTVLRRTQASKVVAVARLMLGLLFVSTGLMKLLIPELREAFSGQLTQAAIPAHAVNMWFVPLAEVAVGLLLLIGLFARLAALVGMVMMIVASYVHLTVHDPALFPLQPESPIIPIIALILLVWIFWAGGGSWSLDLRRQEDVPIGRGTDAGAAP